MNFQLRKSYAPCACVEPERQISARFAKLRRRNDKTGQFEWLPVNLLLVFFRLYRVLHKNWDKLCLWIMAFYNKWTFTFGGLLSSCCHSVLMASTKNERMPLLSAALLNFAWCVKFLFVQVFRLSWEEILSPLSILSVFLPTSHLYTLPASPTTKYCHLEEAGAHLVCWHQRPLGQKFPTQHPCALCCCHCCGRVAFSVSGFPRSNGISFLLQGYRHKTVVQFKLTGQFVGWFTLRLSFNWGSSKERAPFLLFVSVISPLPAFLSIFLPPHNPALKTQ